MPSYKICVFWSIILVSHLLVTTGDGGISRSPGTWCLFCTIPPSTNGSRQQGVSGGSHDQYLEIAITELNASNPLSFMKATPISHASQSCPVTIYLGLGALRLWMFWPCVFWWILVLPLRPLGRMQVMTSPLKCQKKFANLSHKQKFHRRGNDKKQPVGQYRSMIWSTILKL